MLARSPRPAGFVPRDRIVAVAGPGSSAVWWMVIILLVVTAFGLERSSSPDEAFACAVAASTASLAWLFARGYARDGNALGPIPMSALYLFLLYPFHGAITRGTIAPLVVLGADADRWLVDALLVQTLTTPALWLGFRARLGARLSARLWSPGNVIDDAATATHVRLLMVYAVASGARIVLFASGRAFHFAGTVGVDDGDAPVQFALAILAELPGFVVAYFLAQGLRSRRPSLVALAVGLFAVEIGWGLVTGSRSKMIAPALGAIAAVSYVWRPLGARAFAVALTLFALVLFPFATSFRAAYFERMGEVQRDGVQASTITASLAAVTDDDRPLAIGDGPLETLAERLHGLTSFSLVMALTPERHDYLLGESLLLLPAQILVPRAVWPDKPDPSPFTETFRHDYWGLDPGDDTSIAVSQLGFLWANLHLPGVLLGTLIYGLVLALLFEHTRLGAAPGSIFAKVVAATLLPMMLQGYEVALDGFFAGLPKKLLVFVLVGWFIARPRRGALAR